MSLRIDPDAPPPTIGARIGIVADWRRSGAQLFERIAAAEELGVGQIWIPQPPDGWDALGIAAVAASQTQRVMLGTAVVPTFPRHPLVTAGQVQLIEQLAPGRLRLGIGSSHRPLMEDVYGLEYASPLTHVRDYVAVLRDLLWLGRVDHHGPVYRIRSTLAAPPRTPILTSALGKRSFRQAGEISDGAISWMCPVRYLLEVALPALQSGAKAQDRPVPTLVAHVLVAMSDDLDAVRTIVRQRVRFYSDFPAYAAAFAASGHAVEDGTDDLADELVVSGDDAAVRQRLTEILSSGIPELAVQLLVVTDLDEELARLLRLVGSLA